MNTMCFWCVPAGAVPSGQGRYVIVAAEAAVTAGVDQGGPVPRPDPQVPVVEAVCGPVEPADPDMGGML